MTKDSSTVVVVGNDEVAPPTITPEESQLLPTGEILPPQRLDLDKLTPVQRRKFEKMLRMRLVVCHYCGSASTKEALRVERDLKGKKLKTSDGQTLSYHKSCKVQHLMGEMGRLDIGEELPLPSLTLPEVSEISEN